MLFRSELVVRLAGGRELRVEAARLADGILLVTLTDVSALLDHERALESRVAELERRCDQLQRERDEAIGRARKAEARAAGAEQAAVTSESSSGDVEDRMAELRRRLEDAEGARDAALADGAERRGDDIDRERLRTALVDALAALGPLPRVDRTGPPRRVPLGLPDRKSTRLNSSH